MVPDADNKSGPLCYYNTHTRSQAVRHPEKLNDVWQLLDAAVTPFDMHSFKYDTQLFPLPKPEAAQCLLIHLLCCATTCSGNANANECGKGTALSVSIDAPVPLSSKSQQQPAAKLNLRSPECWPERGGTPHGILCFYFSLGFPVLGARTAPSKDASPASVSLIPMPSRCLFLRCPLLRRGVRNLIIQPRHVLQHARNPVLCNLVSQIRHVRDIARIVSQVACSSWKLAREKVFQGRARVARVRFV